MLTWLVGSRWLDAALGRGRRGTDHGIVPKSVEARAGRPEADLARAAGSRAHRPGRAALMETEQRIHQMADEVRSDLKGSA